MRFVLFYHSFVSCWNHGNAHFLRGIARALLARGHSVAVYEPIDGWSRTNALAEVGGAHVLDECAGLVPGVEIRSYRLATLDLERALDGADVVIAHEWNVPVLIERLGQARLRGHFILLFHDTHHRAVSDPAALDRVDLTPFDAVLAFGEVLREVYLRRGWGRRVVTWHEAADTPLFKPQPHELTNTDLVWIGNWGDGERDAELQEFLVVPAMLIGVDARLHGVRYPEVVRDRLRAQGFALGGWLPNHRAPAAFAGARFTVHIPRRPYVEMLPGIPTIRIFEALACGIPLISAPWIDAEGLFPDGSYFKARSTAEMADAMRSVMAEPARAAEVARSGLQAIAARHTCAHRADELLGMIEGLAARAGAPTTAQCMSRREPVLP